MGIWSEIAVIVSLAVSQLSGASIPSQVEQDAIRWANVQRSAWIREGLSDGQAAARVKTYIKSKV